MIAESNPELLESAWGRTIHDMVRAGKGYEAFLKWGMEAVAANTDQIDNPKIQRTVWDRQLAAAEKFNDPGRFTALIGFEWTSINNMQNPSNLHRVVIFKDGADRAGQVLPFSTFDSPDPERLWEYMAGYEERTGGSVLAIPHNGNLSNGLMFAIERLNGQPLDKAYAEARMRWEPLYEVTQIKGDGEAHAKLSLTDEFADYGTWDKGDIAGFKAKERLDAAVRVRPDSATRWGCSRSRSSASILSSSAWSAAPTPTRRWPRHATRTIGARCHPPSPRPSATSTT